MEKAFPPRLFLKFQKEFYQQYEDQVNEFVEELCAGLDWENFQQLLELEIYDILGKTDCAINKYVGAYVEDLISKMIDMIDEE